MGEGMNTSVELSTGEFVEFDLYRLTRGDQLALRKGELAYDAFLGKATGKTEDEIAALPLPDWKKLDKKLGDLLTDGVDANPT